MEVDNVEIETVHESKFLGVLIDYRLCWKVSVLKDSKKNCWVLGKTRHIPDYTTHCALCVAYLTYCVEVMEEYLKKQFGKGIHIAKKGHTGSKPCRESRAYYLKGTNFEIRGLLWNLKLLTLWSKQRISLCQKTCCDVQRQKTGIWIFERQTKLRKIDCLYIFDHVILTAYFCVFISFAAYCW